MCGAAGGRPMMATGVWPARTDVIIGAAPEKGTRAISSPIPSLNMRTLESCPKPSPIEA
jgi:hypothetical protein